jgi:hypothetical protein
VNGKLRGRLSIGADGDDETIKRALEDGNVKRFLEGEIVGWSWCRRARERGRVG